MTAFDSELSKDLRYMSSKIKGQIKGIEKLFKNRMRAIPCHSTLPLSSTDWISLVAPAFSAHLPPSLPMVSTGPANFSVLSAIQETLEINGRSEKPPEGFSKSLVATLAYPWVTLQGV